MLADTAKLAVELNLQGNFNSNIAQAGRNLDTFNKNVSRTAQKVGPDLGHGIRRAGQNIERLAFAGAALAAGGGAAAVKWAGDFEAGMRTINSVALASEDVLKSAGEGLRTTFRETGASMADLQSAEYDLVSAGIKLKDAQEGVNTAVHLGIGALGTTSEAVDVLTTAINSYNLKAADGTVKTGAFARVSDELAQAVADGKVKLSEIAASYAQVAPVAAAAGVSTGEIAASLGFLTAKGVPAAEVMTQMNRALVELQKPKPELQKVFDALHTNGLKLIKKEGLAGALETIRVEAKKLGIPFIDLFGRIDAFKFALQTTGPNAAGFAAELDRIAHSAGMTNKQFDERAQGFNYQMGVLKANVQDAGITIGTALLPKLTEMATKVADFLRTHQDDIKHFGDELAKGFSKAADYIMSIDWASIGGALKGLVSFGRGLADAFMSMPTEAKQLLLGLYGLNKLSGGAVINIGVDLAKGGLGTLFNQFLGRGSMVNPMYVVPLGGGLGGGPPSPAGPGSSLVDKVATGLTLTVPPLLVLNDTINKLNDANSPDFSYLKSGPNIFGQTTDLGGGSGPSAGRPTAPPVEHRGLTEGERELVDAVDNAKDKMEANRIATQRVATAITRLPKVGDLQRIAAPEMTDAVDRNIKSTLDVRDKIEANRIALASKAQETTNKVGDLQRVTASGTSQVTAAIRNNRPIVNVSVRVAGSKVDVYQSHGTVTGNRPGWQGDSGQ